MARKREFHSSYNTYKRRTLKVIEGFGATNWYLTRSRSEAGAAEMCIYTGTAHEDDDSDDDGEEGLAWIGHWGSPGCPRLPALLASVGRTPPSPPCSPRAVPSVQCVQR